MTQLINKFYLSSKRASKLLVHAMVLSVLNAYKMKRIVTDNKGVENKVTQDPGATRNKKLKHILSTFAKPSGLISP